MAPEYKSTFYTLPERCDTREQAQEYRPTFAGIDVLLFQCESVVVCSPSFADEIVKIALECDAKIALIGAPDKMERLVRSSQQRRQEMAVRKSAVTLVDPKDGN